MQEIVEVSKVENLDKLKAYIEDLFKRGRYEEIAQAVGMHSLFIKPEYTRTDMLMLLRYILGLIKNKISRQHAEGYSAWLSSFPKRLTDLIESKSIITEKTSDDVLASRYHGYGPFRSLDEFFFWAMEDKRLQLRNIVKYVEKTAEGTK